jgi:hypothetical protein
MATETRDHARVAIIRTTPERVLTDYRRVLELSGCLDLLAGAERVVAYGNLTWGRFVPAVSSPPWQLDGVAGCFPRASGWRWVTGTGHAGRPRRGASAHHWPEALRRHGHTFDPLARGERVSYPNGMRLMVLDQALPSGVAASASFAGAVALHLPTLKTHGQLGLAGAVENAWCTWLPAGGGLLSIHPHEVVVDLLRLQRSLHTAVCAVMDGTLIGDGAGPRSVDPFEGNVLLASTDPVALDAVAAQLAGFDPFGVRYLSLAYALGLGCADTDRIEIVGDDLSGASLRLHVRRPPAALLRSLLDQIGLGRLEAWLFRHTGWLAVASTIYFDILWYHLVGQRRVRAFQRTRWGAVFESYARGAG